MQARRLFRQRKSFRAVAGPRQLRVGMHARAGLSLLEVVLALAILMMAMTAINGLITTGARASTNAKLQTEALLRCESLLTEIATGRVESATTDETVFVDDPAWSWQSTVESVSRFNEATSQTRDIAGLSSLSVTVRRRNSTDDVIALSTLTRFVPNANGGGR